MLRLTLLSLCLAACTSRGYRLRADDLVRAQRASKNQPADDYVQALHEDGRLVRIYGPHIKSVESHVFEFDDYGITPKGTGWVHVEKRQFRGNLAAVGWILTALGGSLLLVCVKYNAKTDCHATAGAGSALGLGLFAASRQAPGDLDNER